MTQNPTPTISWNPVITPDGFITAPKLSTKFVQSYSELSRSSIPSPHQSRPAQSQSPSFNWETGNDSEQSKSSRTSSESDCDSSSDEQQKRKEKKRKRKSKSLKQIEKKSPRLSTKDKKIVLRSCVHDFEIYAHSKSKNRFWEAVRQQVKEETGKDHASLNKTVKRWESSRRHVLKLIAENKFSGEEEDDRELLIVLDEWISHLDSLKQKQQAREDRIGKAGDETAESKRIQENLGRRWTDKERSPVIEVDDLNYLRFDNQDSQIFSTGPLSSTSPSLVHVESSVSARKQTSAASFNRPSKRTRQLYLLNLL